MGSQSQVDLAILEDVRLRAAVGYLELGMLEEAWEEMGELSPSASEGAPAVKVRLMLLLHEGRWSRALEESQRLAELAPSDVEAFIHAAYCLHELGRTREAERMLLEAPSLLEREAVYHYNLACYKAVLGELEAARRFLAAAFALDPALREAAAADPDLENLRASES